MPITPLRVLLVAVVLAAAAPRPAAAAPVEVFGKREIATLGLDAVPRWRKALATIAAERARYAACDRGEPCAAPVAAWRAAVRAAAGAAPDRQLAAVNAAVNRVRYVAEAGDDWQSPLRFLVTGGDCEDYAIAKYVALRELGVPAARLRIVVLNDTARGLAHAVLTVVTPDGIMVLDNVRDAILSDRALARYVPLFAVNEDDARLLAWPGPTLAVTGRREVAAPPAAR